VRPNGFATQEARAEGHKDVEQILGFKVSTITYPTLGKPENHRLESDDFNGILVRFEEGVSKTIAFGNIFELLGLLTKMHLFCKHILWYLLGI